jgi:hypothetical protein
MIVVSLMTRPSVLAHDACPDESLSGTSSVRTSAAVFHELAVRWIKVLLVRH